MVCRFLRAEVGPAAAADMLMRLHSLVQGEDGIDVAVAVVAAARN